MAGICSGLFGIGGGLIIVPALVLIFGFDTKTAIGTSLFVILLPTGLLGVWQYWKNEELRISAGFWIALGVFCGAYFGAIAAGAVTAATMKRLYAVFLFVVAMYFLLAPRECHGDPRSLTSRNHRRRAHPSPRFHVVH